MKIQELARTQIVAAPLGEAAHVLLVRRQLARIFEYRQRVVAARFGEAKERT